MASDYERNIEIIGRLTQVFKSCQRLVIVGHDNPDPDYLASAMALKFLAKSQAGIPSVITCGGVLGRAENRAMARLLKIHLTPMAHAHFARTSAVVLLDTQPGTGNNSLPRDVKSQVVIDHHPRLKTTNVPLVDIRTEYGATSTIVTEYLLTLGLEMPASLATALAYGIASETLDLSRDTGDKDVHAYLYALVRANKRLLAQVAHPKVSRYYFTAISRALTSAFYYRNIIGARLGEVTQPDVIAQVADLLLSLERMSYAICTGFFDNQILVSVRSTNSRSKLGSLMKKMTAKKGTAGGHELSAAAQIPCGTLVPAERLCLEEELILDFIHRLTHQKEIEAKALIAGI